LTIAPLTQLARAFDIHFKDHPHAIPIQGRKDDPNQPGETLPGASFYVTAITGQLVAIAKRTL
jgi:hypothetical protein